MYGFELVHETEIAEYRTRARLFWHTRTGAELLSLQNDDENKVFTIAFRTPPADATGVAHILEHSVLSGSKKYPIHDPFRELVKGSLKTFVNAFTSADMTAYPVASQNLADFFNLVEVYLDAVLNPLLDPQTLMQEGWHFEVDEKGEGRPLLYRGIVFNEMKGVYGSPDAVLYRHTIQSLFPDTPYALDSGGDPQHIPDLTYAQFKQFHDAYYHPSNGRVLVYGDAPEDEMLRRIGEAFAPFDRLEIDSRLPLQPRWDAPRRVTRPYQPGQEGGADAKGMLTVNWLWPEKESPETTLALSVLTHILLGTPGAPLRKALLDSGLGQDLAGGGMSASLRQMYFSTGLKGIAVADAPRVEQVIWDTLRELAARGFTSEEVEAALNTVEFRLRENNTGSFPRGLSLLFRAMTTWLYEGDPLAPLRFEAPLAALRARLAQGERVLEGLVQAHLLDNPHHVVLLLTPDPDLRRREEAAERARLAEARGRMTEADLQAIAEAQQKLKARQSARNTSEQLALIPSLKLSDLERENKPIPSEGFDLPGAQGLYHNLFTNGIVYLDLGLDLTALPQDLLPYVPLYGRALTEMGTAREDYVRLAQRLGRLTGGVRASTLTTARREDAAPVAQLVVRGKATAARAGDLLEILKDLLLTVRLDLRERFRQMVLEEKADQEAALLPSGHSFASARVRSRLHLADWAEEEMGGLSYLDFLRRLAEQVDADWPAVQARLEEVHRRLVNRNGLWVNVTLDEANWRAFAPRLADWAAALPAAPQEKHKWTPASAPRAEGFALPSKVNYVAQAASLYAAGYTLHGSAQVAANHLRNTYLYQRIRMQGGAYGAACAFDHLSGIWTFTSYRDPHLSETLDAFRGAAAFLRQSDLGSHELTRNIIGVISQMDAYRLPDAKGYVAWVRHLAGETDARRQRQREEVLSTTVADLHRLAEALETANAAPQIAALGSAEALEAANASRAEPFAITKVL